MNEYLILQIDEFTILIIVIICSVIGSLIFNIYHRVWWEKKHQKWLEKQNYKCSKCNYKFKNTDNAIFDHPKEQVICEKCEKREVNEDWS